MNKSTVLLKDYSTASASQKQTNRRIDYLYETFVLDKQVVSIAEFVDLINKCYYKYAADEYLFPWDLRSYYVDVLDKLEPGFDIVDIGAGTGFSYELIRTIGYGYSNYYFVEPSKNMSDKLQTGDPKLVVINDYIENCWLELKQSKNKKLFIMNAAMHHIIDLDRFAKELRDAMNVDDVFFIPYEPNNGYHKLLLASLFRVINTLKNPKSIIVGLAGKLHLVGALQNLKRLTRKFLGRGTEIETYYLTKALNDLVSQNLVSPEFTEQMIYAITDYGVFDNWSSINIPNEFNEGFYTLDNLSKILGLQIVYLKTYTFQHPASFKANKWRQLIDQKLRKYFPSSGAFICAAFKK